MDKRLKSHFHWPLFWVTVVLTVIGIVNLHSATYDIATGGVSSLVTSQLVWILSGFLIALVLLWFDYRVFLRLAYPLYGVSILLLVAVLFFGKEVAGNRNWLAVGPLTVQPSEFAKVAFLLALGRYLSEQQLHRGVSLGGLIRPGLLVLLPLLSIVLAKDLGSALFFGLAFISMMLFAGIRRKALLTLLFVLLVGGAVGYTRFLSHHQKARIEAFLHPEEDPKGRGYQLLQSKIAVGSGRILGKGYLKGMHNKLLYLPAKHTDFIFPVLAEEWGFLGSMTVLALYGLLLTFGIQIASKAKERFGVFLGLGVTALFFWQIAINLGGVLGLMPLTGVTLPLLSYGGSSMVTILIGISLLLNISMRRFMF